MDDVEALKKAGLRPSLQRPAVARFVLHTDAHPTADEVFAAVARKAPTLSRATIYNTLNAFVDKGLLTRQVLDEGRVVYDPHMAPHHHFVDDKTGAVMDVPWDALDVRRVDQLKGVDVRAWQVVLRGRIRNLRG